jgi:glycosyltransferase involved in cell wall biosynthesis
MNREQKKSAGKAVKAKAVRPVLIASENTLFDYPMFLEHLLVGLVAESIPVALVCPPNCNVDSIVSPLVEIIRHPVFDLPFMGHYNRKLLTKKLKKFKPTVLHCLCEGKALQVRRLSHLLSLPYVLTVNSLQKSYFQFFISSSRCARITVPAESIAANLAGISSRLARRIVQVNMGAFVGEGRGHFCDASLPVSVVIAHRLDDADDFEKVFGALRHLAIDGREFMLVIIGDGVEESQVRKLLEALGLSDMVTIVPLLKPWDSVLAVGDIFIRLAPDTSFDPLLLEAMSLGLAVAGCKGGVDDLIIEGKTAVVFDPEDELSIYGSLQRLFDRRELTRQLAWGGQEHLRENYTVSKMVSDILQTYREVGD